MSDPKKPDSMTTAYAAAGFAGVNRGAAETAEMLAKAWDFGNRGTMHTSHVADGLKNRVYSTLQDTDGSFNKFKTYDAATATAGQKKVESLSSLFVPAAALTLSAIELIPAGAAVAATEGAAAVSGTAGEALSVVGQTLAKANLLKNAGTLAYDGANVAKGLVHAP